MTVFDRLEAFAVRPAAFANMTIWAAAEAIVLPIVPDVGLCLLVLAAPRTVGRLFLAVVAGALVGTMLLAGWSMAAPDAARAMLLGLPGIDAAILADVDATVAEQGLSGFAQLGPGAPLKVYTEAWIGQGGDVPGLLAGAILNRLTRIGPAVLVAVAIGWRFRRWIRSKARPILFAYVVFWILVYALYLA